MYVDVQSVTNGAMTIQWRPGDLVKACCKSYSTLDGLETVYTGGQMGREESIICSGSTGGGKPIKGCFGLLAVRTFSKSERA